MDGIEIELYDASSKVLHNGHMYTPYCYLTKVGFINGKGKAVMLLNDNSILVDSRYKDSIYKRKSQWCGLKTENIQVTPTGVVNM